MLKKFKKIFEKPYTDQHFWYLEAPKFQKLVLMNFIKNQSNNHKKALSDKSNKKIQNKGKYISAILSKIG